MTTFSIIIPVYNVEKYIRQCIESLINQTFQDFEAIFVDDCGSDKSMEIVEQYASNDSRIKIIKNEKNLGVAVSRNKALDFCSGEYTTCLDPDDWFASNALEVIYNAFMTYKVNSVWFDANKYDEKTQTFDEESFLACTFGFINTVPSYIINYSEYCWGKAYKTSSIKDNNIYWPEGLKICEDAVFYYKYFTHNSKGIVLEDRLYNYRVREGSAASDALKGRLNLNDLYVSVRKIYEYYKSSKFYEKYKITVLKYLRRNTFLATFVFNSYKKSQKMTKSIIDDLCFPSDFEEFNIPLNPLVSVIIPITEDVFDYTQLIKSVQCQSHKNIEILCVVKKGIENIINLKNLQSGDFRIKIIQNNDEKDFNFSDCVVLTQGNYVMFLDKFVIKKSNFIETVIDKFKDANIPTILCDFRTQENDIVEKGFSLMDDEYKSLILQKKILPIFNKFYLAKCDYDILNLLEKYQDFYLFC